MRWRTALLALAAAAVLGAMTLPAISDHNRNGTGLAIYPYYYDWAPASYYGGRQYPSRRVRACERRVVVDTPRGVFARRAWVC
jgi:hypothetical protein